MGARARVVLVYGVALEARQAGLVDRAAREDLERHWEREGDEAGGREHETPAMALKDAGWSERFELRGDGWHPGHSDPQWYEASDAEELGVYAAGFEVEIPRGKNAADVIARGPSAEDEREWREAVAPILQELGLPSEARLLAVSQTL